MSSKVLIIGCGGTGTRICNEMVTSLGYEMPYDRMSVVILDAHGDKGFESGAWTASKQNVYPMNSYTPVNQGVQKLVRQLEQDSPGCVNSWFPREMRLPSEALYSDGCGAYRPYGKFFAYYYYDNIRATIERGFDRLRHSDYLSHNQRSSTTRVDVIICGSLGNGTGGGIFMDVAGIVNDIILSTQEVEPRVYGFFVPSSVTYNGPNNSRGHNNLQPYQIAAAGYAALVELQMEFARKNDQIDSRMKPNKPYSSQFYSRTSDGFRHEVRFDNPNKSAYDTVYLFDKKDDFGNIHSYHTVVKSAGQTLAALIGGQADPSGRLLDVGLRFQEQCFASMGVARLKVPTADLTEALVCRMSQKIISEMCATSSNVNLGQWGQLLNLTIGATQFPPPDSVDVSLQQYVQAFVGKFLQIQETGSSENGDESENINQLFDAFATLEAQGDAALQQHVKALQKAEGTDILAKANAVSSSYQTYLNGLPETFGSVLMDTKWSAEPREEFDLLNGLEGVGCKFLIDGMVERLINGQAFGLLEAWLEALWLEVKKNKDSVERTELAKYLKLQSFDGVDVNPEEALSTLGELKNKLSDQASGGLNSFFSKMMGGSEVEDTVQEFISAAKNAKKKVTWSVKIQAVEQLYNAVLSHIDRWRTVSAKLNNYIRGNDVLGYIDSRYSDVSGKLNGSSASNGSITEYLSCSPAAQEHLIKELLKDDKLKTENIFRNSDFSSKIWALMYTKVEASEKGELEKVFLRNLGGDSALREITRTQKTFLKGFPSEFLKNLTGALRPFVGPLCKVDNLLREDSEALVENYYYKVFKEDNSLTVVERREIETDLYRVIPHSFSDELNTIFGRRDSEMSDDAKIKAATDIVFIGRMKALANAALSKIDVKMARSNFINGSVTVIYGENSDRINELRPDLQSNLAQLKNNMTGSLQSLDSFPPDEILAIGGVYGMTLEDLNMQEIRSKYIAAMKESSEKDSRARFNFAPHTTQEFMELGSRYIAHTDSAARDDYSAELVLALSAMQPKVEGMVGTFGWLNFVNPSFKIVKAFPDSYDNDESLPQCMLAKSMASEDKDKFLEPYGFEDVIHWLEGSSQNIPNGPEWLSGLKRLVWEEIKRVMFSDPNDFLAEDVPVETFLQALDNRATELSGMLKYKKIQSSIEAMIEGISRFKREIEDNGGLDKDRIPSMLAD